MYPTWSNYLPASSLPHISPTQSKKFFNEQFYKGLYARDKNINNFFHYAWNFKKKRILKILAQVFMKKRNSIILYLET